MANTDPDILEITAIYGTQAVCIKKEVDEGDTEDYKEDIIINNTLWHDIISVPLVYTTRLDQMNAFKKIQRHTSKEATEMILNESKPRYEQIPEQIKLEPQSDLYITSYIQLCSHVQELNTKVRFEAYNTYLRNEKLLKMCKPLKIVLEDVEKNKVKLPAMKISECLEFECSSGEDTPPSNFSDVDGLSSWSSDENVSLSKSTSYSIRGKAKTNKVTILAIKDKRSQEADIYVLDSFKGVKSYYRTHIKECDTLKKRYLSKSKIVVLEYCCWVNREKRIINFIQTGFAGASVFYFLRKPHNCLPRPCTCCCVVGTPIPNKHSDSQFKLYNEKSFIEMKDCHMPRNVLVGKAYVYSNELNTEHNAQKPQTDAEPTIYLKCAVIIIKYQRVIFAQTELLGETYEIGNKGDIEHFMKPTVNRSLTEEKELCRKYDEATKVTRQYFSYLICCWHMRENIINQLRDCNKLSPTALKFMRNPHLCRSDKCECCCKLAPIFSFPSNNVTITTQKNTVNKKKQMKVKLRNKKKYTRTSIHLGSIEEQNMDTKNQEKTQKLKKRTSKASRTVTRSSKKPRLSQNISQNDRNPIGFVKPSSIQENIDLTIDSSNLSNQILKNPPDSDSCNYTDTTHSPTTTPAKGFLDKFKGLKLALNEKGKLTAMINTPPDKLSTMEIKIISDILSLATTQIEKLGITPEEFCKQVNSRPMTHPSRSVMPLLVPILDSPNVNKPTSNTNDRRTPEFSRSNFTTTVLSQNVTCVPQACKAHSLKLSFPTTQNKSTASGFYQMMSSLGGVKNQHLLFAYKHHFKEKIADVLSIPENQNLIPKITKVYSLVENEPIVKRKRARAPAKHKNPKEAKQTTAHKKLRIITPQELFKKSPQTLQKLRELKIPVKTSTNSDSRNKMNGSQLVIGADNNPIPLFVNDTNLIPIHNTIDTDVSESVMEADHSQIPLFVGNGNIIPIQNTSVKDVQQTMMEADLNPPPLFVNNTNLIPIQNTSSTDVSEFMIKAHHNQIPLLVSNSNFIPIHNTNGKDVPQPMVGADLSPPLHFVRNSNYNPIQNTIDAVVSASVMGAHHSQVPFFVSNDNLIPINNTSGKDVQQPMMGAEHNQIPPCVTNKNLIPYRNKKKKIMQNTNGMDIPEVNKEEPCSQIPSVSDAILSDTVAPGMLIVTKKTSTATDNPLLFQMLGKTLPIRPPRPPALAPLSSGSYNSKKVRPLIQAHSKGIRKAKRKIDKAEEAVQLIETSGIDIDMDFESSLKTNVINIVRPDQTFKDEVTHVLDNIPITLIDDDTEGIFGV